MSIAVRDLVDNYPARTKPRDRLVLGALAGRADAQGRCWPSLEDIARRSGLGVRAVRYALRSLEAAGLLDVQVRRGRSLSNLYRIRLEVLQAAAASQRAPDVSTALPIQPDKTGTDLMLVREKTPKAAPAKTGTGMPVKPEKTGTVVHKNRHTRAAEPSGTKFTFADAQGTARCAPPPGDLAKAMFDCGVRFLGDAGIAERKARRLIGRWRKGRDPASVLEALATAQREGATDPVSFIEAVLRRRSAEVIPFRTGVSDDPSARFVAPSARSHRGGDQRPPVRSFASDLLAAAGGLGFFDDP